MAAVLVLALIGGLAWAWWPAPQNYRPIQAYERGTISDVFQPVSANRGSLSAGAAGQLQTVWPAGTPRPTAAHPQLAMVLVPRDGRAPSWVFPFTKPSPPKPGDNQALAVNTTDGSVLYDVAFALVWVDGGQAALNTNAAYAFAHCTGCTTVAVAFQVVLIVGQSRVVVPQNLSEAVNYGCVDCLTAAVAHQLVLTLNGPLSADAQAQLNRLWAQIAAFSRDLQGLSLSEVQARLDAFEQQLKDRREIRSGRDPGRIPVDLHACAQAPPPHRRRAPVPVPVPVPATRPALRMRPERRAEQARPRHPRLYPATRPALRMRPERRAEQARPRHPRPCRRRSGVAGEEFPEVRAISRRG